jgi:hypothetical protein
MRRNAAFRHGLIPGRRAGEHADVNSDDRNGLIPEDPEDEGLPPVEVDIVDVEPMHEIANEARDDLHRMGFTDDEIDDWARQFVARQGPGDEVDFLTWVKSQEHGH